MNWKLIFQLSLLGLAMAIGTVYFIPVKSEWMFWLVIFIFCAYTIAKKCSSKYFLNGFMVSIFNCIWIAAIHYILFETYYEHNKILMDEQMKSMPQGMSQKTIMLAFSPVIGIMSGIVQGLFSWIASKIVKAKQ